jgi:hypothetical protein
MFHAICNFISLAGYEFEQQLDEEFQYQMDLTDGEYVFWQDTYFRGHQIEPAKDAKAQAILQFFANINCPFSMLRLGRSLSPRNHEHGPITSDEMAFKYLLVGMEIVTNNLYDPKCKVGMQFLMAEMEFRLACELLLSYENELVNRCICPEISALVSFVIKKNVKIIQ